MTRHKIKSKERGDELTTVVPAECMLYDKPDVFIRRCTSAIWAEIEAVGVPMGMRQKSAVHFGGVLRLWFVIFTRVHLTYRENWEVGNGMEFFTQLFECSVEKCRR